jgi:two-component system chemotaxis sensor kinase CheA
VADDLLSEFISESREHLSTIETDLLAIEEGGTNIDEDLVNKVFRAAHSIKGGSSFLGLNKVKDLAHKAETVLDMLRSSKIAPNAEVTNILLAAFDKLREMINNPAQSEQADTADLIVGLIGLASSYLPDDKKASLTQVVSLKPEGNGRALSVAQVDLDRAKRSGLAVYCVDYDLIHDIEQKGLNILGVFRELAECGEILDCNMDFEAVGTLDAVVGNQLPLRLVIATSLSPSLMPEILCVAQEKISLLCDAAPIGASEAFSPPAAVASVAPAAPPPLLKAAPLDFVPAAPVAPEPEEEPVKTSPAENPAAASRAGGDDTLRVNVGLLENLMNLAGELVLSRNQLRSAMGKNDLQSVHVAGQRLNQVTTDLEDAIMRTRLQPVGNVFGRFPRVVRDMANRLHKEITLDIQGNDVALDRSLIEGLSDPLTHMVRNAVDHGIETPEERILAGKKKAGQIRIEARHEAGQVVVEISDDGKGINVKKVADIAVAKGLITAEKIRSMTSQEKLALIFLPGLSTAEKITDISGRGVGMDVVKTNLDRLGGQIKITSEPGKGSIFRIKLPLTLAIIPSLIVSMEEERFAIPQLNVEELLYIRGEDLAKRVEVVGTAEVLRLRDRVLPLLRLDAILSDGNTPGAERTTIAQGAHRIAVVTTGSLSYGLVVTAFHDTEEVVVKPLGRHIKGLREYAGATILGDGTVTLILDIAGLAFKAELGAVMEGIRATEQAGDNERKRLEDAFAMLLFHNGPDEIFAAPLDIVQRIERVKPGQVENKGGRRTMQYRGTTLPLVTLSDTTQIKMLDESCDLAVLVSSVRGREVGLLGAMPVDVVETKAEIDTSVHHQVGISGSAIIRDQTTLVVDLVALVDAIYPEWIPANAAPAIATEASVKDRPTVLVAEDSDFFRNQVTKYLEQDGFAVLAAPDGEAAWELLQENADRITIVVTDIEMPRLTGLGLAQRIRSSERFARLPIIALSSLAGEDDVAKGKAAGITEYQVKLDRDNLISGIHALVAA